MRFSKPRERSASVRRCHGIDAPSVTASSDEALAVAAARGSRHAFSALVDRYGGRVVTVLEQRTGDHHTALDVAQEVWIRAFSALPRFTPEGSFRSWLFSIVLNASRDAARGRRRSPVTYSDQVELVHSPDVGDERAAIDAALRAVAEPFRTALSLVDCEGLAYEEAASALRCSVGTVKSRVSRGRRAFRRHWERLTGVHREATTKTTPEATA